MQGVGWANIPVWFLVNGNVMSDASAVPRYQVVHIVRVWQQIEQGGQKLGGLLESMLAKQRHKAVWNPRKR